MISKKKTTVSVLRQLLGISLEEFAALIGKSVSTVGSLESGRLKLSEETALRIQDETGAPADWLLKNDPSLEPIIPGGLVWNEEIFEVHQGKRAYAEVAHKLFGKVNYSRAPARQRQAHSHAIAKYLAMKAQADIHACLAHAILKGDHEFEKAVLALNRFLARLDKQFGSDEPTRELYEKEIAQTAHALGSGQPVLFTQHGKNYQVEKDGKIRPLPNKL